MAPRGEKSNLKRPRGPISEEESDLKRPRRSERLASTTAPVKTTPVKTPVSRKQQLPSPSPGEFGRDPSMTPLVGNGRFPPLASQDPNASISSLSSAPEATQPFGPSQAHDQQAALEDEVRDEVRDGVWGYLYPLDPRYKVTVLKKRSPVVPKGKGEGAAAPQKAEAPGKKQRKGAPAKGYLIGRHPECDILVDDQVVSNRHCLIFAENKDEQLVAVLEDLSSNGTYVNEAIVGRNQRRELKEQDEIAILNDVRFVFKYPKSRQTSEFHKQYKVLQKLGNGHFAEVFMCVERSSGQCYAVKVFGKRPELEDPATTLALQQEIAVLMGVEHPNVLGLHDTFYEPDGVKLVLELAPEGELFNLIIRKQKLSEPEARKLFRQIFQGVKYLHDHNIVHRDIKPENILIIDTDLHVKLADFGLAKIIGDESFTTTMCGTPSYIAPEILAEPGRRKYTKAVDIWSLGVVLYICMCGFPPFSDELMTRRYPFTMADQIKNGRFDYSSPDWDSVGDAVIDLIDRMLVVNPGKRYTIDQCLNHPWIKASTPDFNDSTGLIGGLQGLGVGRRGVTRERTLLARMNSIQEQRVTSVGVGDDKRTVAVFPKKKDRVINVPTPQPRPADARRPAEFMHMGGNGDQPLFDGNDEESAAYSKDDIAQKKKKSAAKGRR